MDYVLGTLRNGRIVLDEQPDWPDGQRVGVMPTLEGEPPGTVLPRVRLVDGSEVPFNGSLDHVKLLADQMGLDDPEVSAPEKEPSFSSLLEEVNRRYGRALKRLAD